MLNDLLTKTLKEEKNPSRRLLNILMIIAISVLFSIIVGNKNDLTQENKDLKKQIDELVKRDNRIIDSLKDEKYNDNLNFYQWKYNYSRQIDSLIYLTQKK